MNRRRFFAWLTGTAAGVALAPTLDVDKLLWEPGAKTILLPTPTTIRMVSNPRGISIRFLKQWDIVPSVNIHSHALAFHPDAFKFVMDPLHEPALSKIVQAMADRIDQQAADYVYGQSFLDVLDRKRPLS